jgi:hypothetical protein
MRTIEVTGEVKVRVRDVMGVIPVELQHRLAMLELMMPFAKNVDPSPEFVAALKNSVSNQIDELVVKLKERNARRRASRIKKASAAAVEDFDSVEMPAATVEETNMANEEVEVAQLHG